MRASYTSVLTLVSLLLVAPPTQAGESHARDSGGRRHVTISIVGTDDLHGHIEALPRFGGYVAISGERGPDGGGVVLVDAGDMFQGTLESNLTEGAAVVRAYNALRYDAVAIGNHEFDFGPVGPATSPRAPGGRSARRAQGARRRGALPVPGRQPRRRRDGRAARLAELRGTHMVARRRREGRHHRPRERRHRVHHAAGELRGPARPPARAVRHRGGEGSPSPRRRDRHRRRARRRLVQAARTSRRSVVVRERTARSSSSRAPCRRGPSTRSSPVTRTPGSPSASPASRSSRPTTRGPPSGASTSISRHRSARPGSWAARSSPRDRSSERARLSIATRAPTSWSIQRSRPRSSPRWQPPGSSAR